MTIEGQSGYGSTLGHADTAEAAPTELGDLWNITPPKTQVKAVKWTPLDAANEYEKSAPGTKASGELPCKVTYDETQSQALHALAGVMKHWTITYPDGSGHKFQGFISQIGEDEVNNDNVITTSFTITVNGPITPFDAPLT